jgi:hypothetical protein
MDFGSTPTGVFFCQTHDQVPDLCGDPWSAWKPTRFPTPVAAKSSPVPADHGVGFDDDQGAFPTRPELLQQDPEQPIRRVQWRPRPFALEYRHLLSESQNLKSEIGTGPEERSQPASTGDMKWIMGLPLYHRRRGRDHAPRYPKASR